MAKVGIDSFLLDCHTNDNIAEIEATYGIKGFAIVVRLWQKIYSEKGYYCEWSNRSPVLFLSQWFGGNSGVDLNLIKEVVSEAIKIGIFNESMFNKYAILTSERIQKQYFDVVKRRTEIKFENEYLLVSADIFKENVNRNEKNVCRNEKNVCRNSTSKVKERKVKEIYKENVRARPDYDFENAWNKTFEIYPKKTAAVVARQVWVRKIQDVVLENQVDVANLIYKATKLYLLDYDENNPEDEKHRYIPKYGDWLQNDCDYWITRYEDMKKEELDE